MVSHRCRNLRQPCSPDRIAAVALIAADRPSKFQGLHLLDSLWMRVASAPGEGRDFESRRGRTKYSTSCTICRSVANNCLSTHLNDSSKVATARQEILESTSMSTPNPASTSQYRLHLSPLPPPPTLPPAEILKFFSRFGTPTEFYRPGLDGLGQERDYGFLGMDFGEKGEKGLSRCESLRHISAYHGTIYQGFGFA
jgi:hypothetical protein